MEGADALYYTDFTGLNVKRMTELRRRFRKAGVEYVVIKNTLALRAVNESGLTAPALKGPTGVVIAKDRDRRREGPDRFREGERRASVGEGRTATRARRSTPAQVKKLAPMPLATSSCSASSVGALQAPLAAFVGALNGMLT